MNSLPLQIAIDGPVAAGKGDIASRLAKKFNLVYIYTGVMYRALALACLQAGISFKDAPRVIQLLLQSKIELVEPSPGSERSYKVLLDGEDVTERLLNQDVAMAASDVGTIPEVRIEMVRQQQRLAQGRRVVMEGRDIGLRVLPQAQLKIYLTASQVERARRRFKQWQEKGTPKTFAETLEDTKNRDLQDTTRAVDPLQKLPDAWELDTTGLTQEEVVAHIETELKQRNLI